VLVRISSEAAACISANGGELWVWAARRPMCCAGAPAMMHAATTEPDRVSGFTAIDIAAADAAGQPGLRVHFRPAAGQRPDVLEIGIASRRHPRVAAYWDGCLMAMV
jgi:hypothetical protein